MSKLQILFYVTNRGEKPVETFITKQDKPTYAKIIRILELLEENGYDLGMPYAKYLLEGISELRIRGKNEIRIFYIFSDGNNIYLIHAFKKKTQKTPRKELDIAIKRKNELINL